MDTTQTDPQTAEIKAALVSEGDVAGLGPLRRDLIPLYHKWNNHPEIIRGQGRAEILTLEHIEDWYDRVTDRGSDAECFTIYELEDMQPVGRIALKDIDRRHGTAMFSIFVAEGRGRGVGTEATRQALDWAFKHMGLWNVMLEVDSWNERAQRTYQKVGFTKLGVRRECAFDQGEVHDTILMDITKSDWAELTAE